MDSALRLTRNKRNWRQLNFKSIPPRCSTNQSAAVTRSVLINTVSSAVVVSWECRVWVLFTDQPWLWYSGYQRSWSWEERSVVHRTENRRIYVSCLISVCHPPQESQAEKILGGSIRDQQRAACNPRTWDAQCPIRRQLDPNSDVATMVPHHRQVPLGQEGYGASG